MPEAYIVDAVRTAVGKRNGSLAGVHPIDLGVPGVMDCSTGSTSTRQPLTT